mmetsp:Transcript_57664/g.163726  ORF Transcript_57664/g.163726 Transcript_57664/m.163726 type:complete len:221 (+) Transcript_57664:2-664(+)
MTVTVSDLFREYESDFARLREDIDEQLQAAKATGSDDQQCVAEAERRFGRADQALRQMEMEARTMPPDSRSFLDPKIKQYRSDFNDRRKAIDSARQAANRRALLAESAGLEKSVRDRERLLDINENMNTSSRRLNEATRTALETEQIGIDVMSDLRQQRDVILRARGNVGEVGSNTTLAKRLLDTMTRRANQNRQLVWAVAVLMVLMLVVACYFIFKEEA